MTLDDFHAHVKKFDATFSQKWDFGLRLGLIVEESGEWAEAVLKSHGLEKEGEELCDLLYVVLGALDVRGIDIEASMLKVITKNQHKIDNKHLIKISVEGKVVKLEDQAGMITVPVSGCFCVREHDCGKDGPCNGFPRVTKTHKGECWRSSYADCGC